MTADPRAANARYLLGQIEHCAGTDKIAAIAACDAALEIFAPSFPDIAPIFGASKAEADLWAEFAPDSVKVEYLAAILKHIQNVPINTTGARKKALIALWATMTQAERDGFLELVDPGGKAEG